MSDLKEVSKEEFDKFMETYPNKLDVSVIGMCVPSPIAYYDFSIAEGWDAIVATKCEDLGVNYQPTGEWVYKIKGE